MKATIKLDQGQLVDLVKEFIKAKTTYLPQEAEVRVIISEAVDGGPCGYTPASVRVEVDIIL